MRLSFLYSLKASVPVLISFIPVGLAYGILMQTAGYNWVWTGATSLFVFAGALQFLMITFMAGSTSLAVVALMALLLNSRHIFYGIPFIEKWRKYGPWKAFLIFALPDEAFSLHCANDFDDGNPVHKKLTYVFAAALIFFYWIASSIAGALLGSLFTFNTTGIDFALTGLFIVILIEQIKKADSKLPAIIAFVSSVVCLIIIGPDNFILPSLVITVMLLIILRGKIEVPGK